MLTGAALALAINVLTAVFNWVYQKAGRVVTQVFIFVLALIGAAYWQYHGLLPGVAALIAGAVAIFSLAVAFYEVILSYFPLFTGPQS